MKPGRLVVTFAAGLCCVFSACGGGGGGNTPPATLSSVSVAGNASVALGFTQQFVATGNFSDGTKRDVSASATWITANANIAAVSGTGLVTGKSGGSTTVTATFQSVGGSAPVTVSLPTSVTVTSVSVNTPVGLTQQFSASGAFADGSTHDISSLANWSAADSTIASVNASGLVTAKAVGTTSIQASFGGVSGSAAFNVLPPALMSIVAGIDATRLLIGTPHQLTATGTFSDGSTKDVAASSTFQMTNPYVVAVDSQQRVTGVTEGITSLTVSNAGIKSQSIELQSYSKARFAYVPDASRVNSFIVDSGTGLLRPTTYAARVNIQDVCATASIDRSYLLVANYRTYPGGTTSSGSISIYKVDSVTGELTFVSDLPQPAATAGAIYGPGCAAFHPNGHFFYVADETTGFVTAYSFDSGTGTATELSSVRAGSSPRSITVDPLGRFLYVSNANSSDISAFSMDASAGTLSSLAGSPIQSFTGEDIVAIDPRGQFAVVSANNTNQMSVYKIGSNGLFTFVTGSNRTVPSGPSRVIFDPTGAFAYFNGSFPGNGLVQGVVEVDSFNSSTGALTKLATVNLTPGVLNTPVIDPEGKHLYMADNFGGFYVYPMQSDGTLGAVSHFRAGVAINTFSPLTFIGAAASAAPVTTHVYAGLPATGVVSQFDLLADGTFASTVNPTVAAGPVASLSSDFFGRRIVAAAPRSLQPNLFEFTANPQTGNLNGVANPFSIFVQVPGVISLDRSGQFAYITDSFAPEKLTAFQGFNGNYIAFAPSISTSGNVPSLGLDPFAGFLLTANKDVNSVSGYEIQTTNGAFSSNAFVASSYATGTTPVAVYVEPLGRFAYTANQGSGDVTAFRIANLGGLDTLNTIGTSAVASSPSALAGDPFGKFLFVGTTNGSLAAYPIDSSTGALGSAAPAVSVGGAVQALAVDASSRYLIVATDSGLLTYSFASDGTLTLVNQSSPPAAGNYSSITTATAIN